MTFQERPCAAEGLVSYRYNGPFGFIMIGAVDNDDAMAEAARSTHAPALQNLEVWTDAGYVAVAS